MTASLTHELGQPLTAIIMNAEAMQQLLARHASETAIREAIDDVMADAKRATETVHRLRALFRKEPPPRTCVDLHAAIEDVLRLLEHEMRSRHIRARFVHDAAETYVRGDAVQLRQVLINLIVKSVAMDPLRRPERRRCCRSRRSTAGRRSGTCPRCSTNTGRTCSTCTTRTRCSRPRSSGPRTRTACR